MKITELREECISRELVHLDNQQLKRQDLDRALKEHLHGIQRFPALLLNSQRKTLDDLNLTRYEIMPSEPLHDLKEHIKNIMTEVYHLLIPEEQVLFDQVHDAVIANKEKVRGSDYRLFAVVLALQMTHARLTVKRLFYTLAELSELCYAPPP